MLGIRVFVTDEVLKKGGRCGQIHLMAKEYMVVLEKALNDVSISHYLNIEMVMLADFQ